MARKTIIKNGTVVKGDFTKKMDVLVEGEKIKALGNFENIEADSIVDATGLYVLPGAIDTHVHLNDEFMNTVSVHDYYTGTFAAAHGGVTSLVDFSNQKSGEPLINTIHRKREESAGKALIDWGVHPVMTQPIQNIEASVESVVIEGSPTIKCYKTYRDEGLLVEPEDLKKVLAALKKYNGMLMLHTEDNDPIEKKIPELISSGYTSPIYHARSRPLKTENDAIEDVIAMTREIGGKVFIVHMSTGERIDALKQAWKENVNVFVETCTHYLVFTEDMLKRDDGIKWICSPPLRDQRNQDLIWDGLKNGDVFMVTSDDAAYSWEAKLYGKDRFDKCPNGIPGIEPRLNIMYSEGVAKGRISLEQMVRIVSETPAKLFGMYPQKGVLQSGSDADIVLFDPNEEFIMGQDTLHMATDWSAYEGIRIKGRIKKVYSRGDLIIDNGVCTAQKGRGRYIFRNLDPGLNISNFLKQ